jgi:prepilin-type N-terminal cleavage/methylation domain-containing protein
MQRLRTVGREDGFSLLELLVAMVLLGTLLTLGAFAMKNYWLRRALDGSTKQATAQLRQLQQRAVAESHPLIYGARFSEGSRSYDLLRYDPTATTKCSKMTSVNLQDGVKVAAGTAFSGSLYVDPTQCGTVAPTDHFVFFFARGTATGGTLKFTHEGLAGTVQDTTTIKVTNLTGRVEGGY